MKFLVDNALSPSVATGLSAANHDAMHVRDLALAASSDSTIFDRAAADDRTIVSADTNFGTLLALRGASKPSVIQFRGAIPDRAADQVALILDNLAGIANDLTAGAIVTIQPGRIRIRLLPIV